MVSVGAFYKSLTESEIFVFVEENAQGGETEQPRNGASGWIRGVEMALQRPLWAGFGIYAKLHLDGLRGGSSPNGRLARLQGQADHVYNAALSYERGSLLRDR